MLQARRSGGADIAARAEVRLGRVALHGGQRRRQLVWNVAALPHGQARIARRLDKAIAGLIGNTLHGPKERLPPLFCGLRLGIDIPQPVGLPHRIGRHRLQRFRDVLGGIDIVLHQPRGGVDDLLGYVGFADVGIAEKSGNRRVDRADVPHGQFELGRVDAEGLLLDRLRLRDRVEQIVRLLVGIHILHQRRIDAGIDLAISGNPQQIVPGKDRRLARRPEAFRLKRA